MEKDIVSALREIAYELKSLNRYLNKLNLRECVPSVAKARIGSEGDDKTYNQIKTIKISEK